MREPKDTRPRLGTAYRRVDESTGVESISPSIPDPTQWTEVCGVTKPLRTLADFLSENGLKPQSAGPGDPGFDVGWWKDEVFFVAEVKSLTAVNETGQMRLAVGQILDYAHQLRQAGVDSRPVVVVERQPEGRWAAICADHGIALAWRGELERVIP